MTDFRIIFSKKGSLAFISHLDLTHTFIRALKRAGIPLKYSEGFNPRPKMAFGLPLSVGTEGENEILDLSLSRDLSCEDLKEKLQSCLSDELQIKSVSEPGKKIKNIKYAVYRVEFEDYHGDENAVNTVLQNPPPVMKHSKSGEKLTDIKPMIISAKAVNEGASFIIDLTLTAYDCMNLNPEYVIKSINSSGITLPEDYKTTRTDIIFEE